MFLIGLHNYSQSFFINLIFNEMATKIDINSLKIKFRNNYINIWIVY